MLYLDFETFCERDLKAIGTYRYVQYCEPLLMTYAFDDDDVQLIDFTEEDQGLDSELILALRGEIKTAHNANFDRNVLHHALKVIPPMESWRCTMVKAYTMGLPGNLEQLGEALGLDEDEQKLKDGRKLIKRFCTPPPKNHKANRYTKETHPEEWERFKEYAIQDVDAMRTIDKMLPDWNYKNGEMKMWFFDQDINDRGIHVDTDFAKSAIKLVDDTTTELNERLSEITKGEVDKATSVAKLTKWVNTQGINVKSLAKDKVERLLKKDLPAKVREALTIRQQLGKSSTAKYQKLLELTNSDRRLRGGIQFYGALRTGRYAGRGFQPHNLPRPTIKDTDTAALSIINGTSEFLYDDMMEVASSCVRSSITAPEGMKLVVADLANIEGRMLAWLAGEEWKLNAFIEYDQGIGPDLYKLAYSRSFHVPVKSISDDQRQVGKVQELALGYQGWLGAFNQMAAAYGVKLEDDYVIEICKKWRNAHPEIVSWWYELERCAKAAIQNPGKVATARKIKFSVKENWLLCKLPSGRFLCYYKPELNDAGQIEYDGYVGQTRMWGRQETYGGKLAENITQAASRDVLVHSMPLAEEAGYEVVLTVHDELVTEAPDKEDYSVKGLSKIMTTHPSWCPDLPLAADGYESKRYRKG